MRGKRVATIYDIAREAGVSPATVSRVMTNSAGVAQEKRERVQALIEAYHFRPNALAKSLSDTHSKLIGMLCPDARNPYYASLFVACERAAYDRGYTLMLNNTLSQEELEVSFLGKMMEQRVEAILICGGVCDRMVLPASFRDYISRLAQQTPVVVAGRVDAPHCYQLCIDHAEGMRQVVAHLAALGHKKIALLVSQYEIFLTLIKKQAFADAMQQAGLPLQEEYVLQVTDFTESSGAEGIKRLLRLPDPPTAVIGINDLVAVGAMQQYLRMGYAVPDDCSFVGFDDSYLSDLMTPKLTSVQYVYEEYGPKLIRMALDAIEGKNVPHFAYHSVSLVCKESTASPRKSGQARARA